MSLRGTWGMRVRQARGRVGALRGSDSSKKDDSVVGKSLKTLDTGTLYATNLTTINRDTGPTGAAAFRNSRNSRLKGIVWISGFKIHHTWMNTGIEPAVINWAVIHGKSNQVTPNLNDGFFRSYGASRDTDFTNLNFSVDYINNAINTDKFDILKRGRFELRSATNGAGWLQGASRKNYTSKKIWCKLGRQIRYDDDPADTAESPCYFVWWATIPIQNVRTIRTGVILAQEQVITYFRDPTR